MEARQIAQRVAYGHLPGDSPATITPAYERQAELAVELQLERAGVRLAYLLDQALR
jgi:hypothetical protein